MKFSSFVVIMLWMFLQGKSSLARSYETAQEVTFPEQCNEYCFSVLQPFLEYLLKFKEAADANNEMNDRIHSLELTINNLQSQILKSETELTKNYVHQIKVKEEQINGKDKQIKDKDEQMNVKDKQIKDLREQINGKDEEIKVLREEVKMISCLNSGPNGIFNIKVKGMEPSQSPCNSFGWTVIQRRIDGSVDFNRKWTAYKDGFGDIRGEFFLGLEKIHTMTLAQPHELYIQLRDVNGTTKYARYDDFKIGSESEGYKLKSLGEYSGTAGDSLTYHLNMKFTTLDRDNDIYEKANCAKDHGGGWWFNKCAKSSLNGNYYYDGKRTEYKLFGIEWGTWKNYEYDYTISLTFSQMMIRLK
ncbi:fibrinogen-like protein 1 [Drosophila obscura]|uniref:fibrinogen-like protein 1 n=1 Tax=Drosophila obscura TaxID=7282 RepID=UPI001BB14C9E|nr:fibrinogen-like protein 1 [Drosophila obscura]XP_041448373.1 fibrinogen-like protein 1 [Drosophila obscura]XP_041448374.1 fibrinogen-like protein 1 [Drosophila obscura]